MAAIEGCSRVLSRNSEVTVRWVPAHHGVPGNENADENAKAAAEGKRPDSTVPDELRWETSLSHMTRVATVAQSGRTKQWISERLGDPRRKYRPPPGRVVMRKLLRRTPKYIAGRYYQLLSGHAAIGPYLKDKIHKVDDERCLWCGERKRQIHHHLLWSAGHGHPKSESCRGT